MRASGALEGRTAHRATTPASNSVAPLVGTIAIFLSLPFVFATLLRAGKLRGFSEGHLSAPWWRWVLLSGLAASAVLALLAHAWATAALPIAAALMATFNPEDFRRR
jgi:hypothetical protein